MALQHVLIELFDGDAQLARNVSGIPVLAPGHDAQLLVQLKHRVDAGVDAPCCLVHADVVTPLGEHVALGRGHRQDLTVAFVITAELQAQLGQRLFGCLRVVPEIRSLRQLFFFCYFGKFVIFLYSLFIRIFIKDKCNNKSYKYNRRDR